MTAFTFGFFGVMMAAGLVDMVSIQRRESCEIAAERAQRQARIAALTGKCFRPDGD